MNNFISIDYHHCNTNRWPDCNYILHNQYYCEVKEKSHHRDCVNQHAWLFKTTITTKTLIFQIRERYWSTLKIYNIFVLFSVLMLDNIQPISQRGTSPDSHISTVTSKTNIERKQVRMDWELMTVLLLCHAILSTVSISN